jgi:hypothetical protein
MSNNGSPLPNILSAISMSPTAIFFVSMLFKNNTFVVYCCRLDYVSRNVSNILLLNLSGYWYIKPCPPSLICTSHAPGIFSASIKELAGGVITSNYYQCGSFYTTKSVTRTPPCVACFDLALQTWKRNTLFGLEFLKVIWVFFHPFLWKQ